MPFEAQVYKILVASPGDVEDERRAIPEVIAEWNHINADAKKVVLLPIKWETHSAPMMGGRPQAIINEQVVRGCDMLIGVFWTRIGSPTGVSESGTVEEIEWFIKNGKPLMLYFSSKPVDAKKLDLDQYRSLRQFEEKMQKMGLTGSYENITDFREKLFRQISINIEHLISGAPANKPSVKAVAQKAVELNKIIKKGRVFIEDYEKDGVIKSFIVKGDTKSIKEELKKMGGRWNGTLGGWIFPKAKEIEIAEFLKTT
ncbi:hypothetical protein [Mesorhizobium sp. M0678]|uniref:hypothetical protein n=1 Tax=unclassified Mesorhizobium TaxID=325217 RepID=UPI003337E882